MRFIAFICSLLFCLGASSFAQDEDRNISWDGSYLPKVIPGTTFGTLHQATPIQGSPVKPVTTGSLYGRELIQGNPASAVAISTAVTSTKDVVMLDELVPLDQTPIRPASLNTQTIPLGEELVEPQATQLPPGVRNGVFQKLTLTGTWAPTLSDEPDAFGVTDFDSSVVLGFPFMTIESPLLITPRFGIHFFENAAANDLPTRVYDVATEFRHLRQFKNSSGGNGPWAMDAAVSVGYYSDFDQDSGDATRVNGRLLAVYESSPAAKWIFGAVYLNRAGASLLPAAGLIYTPDDATKYELIFPRPRAAWQLTGSTPNDARWLYVGGEFGGGVWSITRPSTGMLDTVNYNDLRLLVGLERKRLGGISHRLEFGYVFYRELEFERPATELQLDDTVFVRAGLSY